MNELTMKYVEVYGATLAVAKTSTGTILVGVRLICSALGLTENQIQNQVRKIRNDPVLAKGYAKMHTLSPGGPQEILAIELDYLPLWLAKINANTIDDPVIRERLINYQLKAKDVLAAAFADSTSLNRGQGDCKNATPSPSTLSTPDWIKINKVLQAKIQIAQTLGRNPVQARSFAIQHTREETGIDLSTWIPQKPASRGHLTTPETCDGYRTQKLADPLEFGGWLRARRYAKGLSSLAVVRAMDGCSIIRHLDYGKLHCPRPRHLIAIANILDIPVEEMMARAGYVKVEENV